jgi:hypothetical protein
VVVVLLVVLELVLKTVFVVKVVVQAVVVRLVVLELVLKTVFVVN